MNTMNKLIILIMIAATMAFVVIAIGEEMAGDQEPLKEEIVKNAITGKEIGTSSIKIKHVIDVNTTEGETQKYLEDQRTAFGSNPDSENIIYCDSIYGSTKVFLTKMYPDGTYIIKGYVSYINNTLAEKVRQLEARIQVLEERLK